MEDRSNDEILADIYELNGSDLNTAREMRANLLKAVSHLIEYTKDRVGLDVEMSDWGLEKARTLSVGDDDPEMKREIFQVLFSCRVAETLLGIKVPGKQFPFLSAAVAGELGIPENSSSSGKN